MPHEDPERGGRREGRHLIADPCAAHRVVHRVQPRPDEQVAALRADDGDRDVVEVLTEGGLRRVELLQVVDQQEPADGQHG